MEPEITIVIPVYNREGIVRRTLDSVAAQTCRPLAVVLVDNGSTDGTPAVLRQWQSEAGAADFHITVLNEKKRGACAARNRGLATVTTPWCMFFDSDDVMLPGHVARALAVARRRPDADVVAWDFDHYAIDGSRHRRAFITRDVLYNNIMHSSFSTQRYMARTDLFRRAGGWREDTRLFDDCELGVRLLALSPVIVHAGREITVRVYESADSISSRNDGSLDTLLPALDAVEASLPSARRHWAQLQKLIMTSTWARRDPRSPALARAIIAAQPSARRLIWRLLHVYSLAGGRGVARIYRLITALRI